MMAAETAIEQDLGDGLILRSMRDEADIRTFDLCIIQGIPYYYRQDGYAYAIDHTYWAISEGF